MQAAGFPVPEIQLLDGATALFMKDPDGIRFEVTHSRLAHLRSADPPRRPRIPRP
jgi:hypothetical protein